MTVALGDRVRVIKTGAEGRVYRISGEFIEVEFPGFGGWSFTADELEQA